MLKFLLSLIGKSDKGRSNIGGLALDIREAIKGKEMDPQRLIELQAEINKVEAQNRSMFVRWMATFYRMDLRICFWLSLYCYAIAFSLYRY
jgi:hypothetical protein